MARTINIVVDADAKGYQATVPGITETNRRMIQSFVTGAQQQAQAYTQSYGVISNMTAGVTLKQRELGSAVSLVASQVGGLGQVAGLASNAIVAMATSSGATGVALGALAGTVGLLMFRIEAAREAFRQLAEIELADIAREKRGLDLEQDIKRRIAVLRSLTHEIEKVRQEFDKTRLELEKGGARPQALAAVDTARNLEIAKIRTEQAKKEADAQAQLRKSLVDQADTLNMQLVGLELGAAALDTYKINNLLASEAVKKLGQEGVDSVRAIEALLAGVRRFNEEQAQTAALAKLIAESGAALDNQRTEELALLEKQLDLKTRSITSTWRKLRASGASEAEVLQKRIELLRKQKENLENSTATKEPGQIAVLTKEIEILELQAQRAGTVTAHIGSEVVRTLDDLFSSLISGTLKAVDVGNAATATLGRIVTDIFSQTIKQKLSFELNLFNNMRQLPGQANNALLSGGGGRGLLQTILFGSGTGQLDPNSTFSLAEAGEGFSNILGGGGGGGGLLGWLKDMLGGLFSGGGLFSNLLGGASSVIGGLLGGGSSGGGGGGFGIANIFSIISTGASALINSTSIGATISTAVLETLSAVISTVSETISTTLTTITTSLASIPGVGWIAAAVVAAISAIYRIIANQQERPNAKLSGQFGGVFFDETSQMFRPGEINVAIGRKSGIKNSQAGQIADNLQQRLIVLADQWVGILNIFPDFVSDQIIPALETTNQRLNANFRDIKFSPGGKRSIQQELEAMSGPDGLVRFLDAFLPSLGTSFWATLGAAGIPNVDTFGFQSISPGFKFPQEDWTKLIQAITDTATITSSLATVGASKFLTPTDLSGVGSIFGQLFSTSDPRAFTEMAGKLKDQLKPVTDFLESSVQEASSLFGRGLVAAMQAATESDGRLAFLQSLNEGIRDTVFNGLSEAFIASAQFSDLLAPIQSQIRLFTQNALTTGIAPNIDEFRSSILPAIEAISTRADLLGPLIDALQSLGFNIREMLGLLPPPPEEPAAPVVTGPQNITIYVQGSGDPEETARAIDRLLRGTLPPP
jgi:hypothetical protein